MQLLYCPTFALSDIKGHAMEEFVFFSLEGISVSNIEFIADEFTCAIQDVISVHHGMIEPSRGFSTFCMLLGAFLMIFDEVFMFVGGFSIALGMIAWVSAKTQYAVVIHTPLGAHHALTSESSHDITRVVSALNKAIIHRQ
jgi:hypothetical protein